jgi:ABC-type iron transport system FetAB permease component
MPCAKFLSVMLFVLLCFYCMCLLSYIIVINLVEKARRHLFHISYAIYTICTELLLVVIVFENVVCFKYGSIHNTA